MNRDNDHTSRKQLWGLRLSGIICHGEFLVRCSNQLQGDTNEGARGGDKRETNWDSEGPIVEDVRKLSS